MGKTYHTLSMLQIFYKLDTLVRHTEFFQILSLWKRMKRHFNTLVFFTSRIYQSYHRCDTMRLKSIPRDKDTSLFVSVSKKSSLLLAKFLINKPFFTWIPQLIACIFFFFSFFVWCYVFVLSLNFSSFCTVTIIPLYLTFFFLFCF